MINDTVALECGCDVASNDIGAALSAFVMHSFYGCADFVAYCINDRSSFFSWVIGYYLFVALLLLSILRRAYERSGCQIWQTELFASFGFILAPVFIIVYVLHVTSDLTAPFSRSDFGQICLALLTFRIFTEACEDRVVKYNGAMYRIEVFDRDRLGRMLDREDRDRVSFEEFYGVGGRGPMTP